MADVRALLRDERNSRRISHPQANYSASGALICLACHLQIKSESLWDGHIKSSQHVARAKGNSTRPSAVSASSESKKRKADETDEGGSKRSKASGEVTGLPEGFFDNGAVDGSNELEPELEPEPVIPDKTAQGLDQGVSTQSADALGTSGLSAGFFDKSTQEPASSTAAPGRAGPTVTANDAGVDEDEWAAFERDIAIADVDTVSSALDAPSTISAPALSAAELAARSTAEANTQRKERYEAEIEGEREDAARQMEAELDEMEALEEKVRNLKAKREELRKRAEERLQDESIDTGGTNGMGGKDPQPVEEDDEEDDEEDEDEEDDDWDGLRLRPA